MATSTTSPNASAEETESELCELPIQGMTCASCVRRVERALLGVPGVDSASVNYATQRARVAYDGSRATHAALVRAVEAAGYKVPGGADESEDDDPEDPIVPENPADSEDRRSADLPEDAEDLGPGAASSAGGLSAGGEPCGDSQSATRSAPRRDVSSRAVALEQAERRERRGLRRDFALAALLTVPLLALAMSHGSVPGTGGTAGNWLQLALAAPVVLVSGRRFFRAAWMALRHGAADMNTLVALGTGAAFGYSLVATVAPGIFPHAEHGVVPHVYYEAAAAIVAFVLLGKLLEARARKRLGEAVRGLVALAPAHAARVTADGIEEGVPLARLAVGDLVLVRPGERMPVDGVVERGRSAVDEAILTGESLPVDKGAGDEVASGTMNQSGALTVRILRTGKDTALARIVEAVEAAQGSRAPIARVADVVSGYFVPVVLVIATLTGLVWAALDPSATGIATAIERFVAVLVIACPCALGLATPAAVAVGTGRGAELGVLVKGGVALESASRVDTVLLDKTGTLTLGRPELTAFVDQSGLPEGRLLSLVASLESESEHPVARAIVSGAKTRGATLLEVAGFRAEPGLGVTGVVAGRLLRIGTHAWLTQAGIASEGLEAEAERLAEGGQTPAFVAVDGALAGLVAVADRPAPEAARVVRELHALGIDVAMISGDRQATANAIARELGIERVFAEVSPEGKAQIVAEERARGRTVAMVGDGINDAPALAIAHVGIAVGTGADIAVEAADIALLRGGIGSLPVALRLARRTLTTIRLNLFWAFVYNVLGIPIAAGALYPATGWLLSPVIAGAAMSFSSVSVLLSSLTLRRFGRGATAPVPARKALLAV